MHEHHAHEGHTHSHDNRSRDETMAMLRYMLRHNEHHLDELNGLARELRSLDLPEQAEEIERGALDYMAGNARLKKALDKLDEIGV